MNLGERVWRLPVQFLFNLNVNHREVTHIPDHNLCASSLREINEILEKKLDSFINEVWGISVNEGSERRSTGMDKKRMYKKCMKKAEVIAKLERFGWVMFWDSNLDLEGRLGK